MQRPSPRTSGGGQLVVTHYRYLDSHPTAPLFTGELRAIGYHDGGLTPHVHFGYTHHGGHSRLGRPTAVEDATGWRALGWRLADGQPEYEWLDHGFFGHNGSTGRDVWYDYDNGHPGHGAVPGRPLGYDAGWGSQRQAIVGLRLGYEAASGRVGSVQLSGGFGPTVTFAYGYQAGGDAVAAVTAGADQRSTPWQTWRELPDVVHTTWSGSSRAQFVYHYDWVGQRTREEVYGPYPRYLGWNAHGHGFARYWAHDSRGRTNRQHTPSSNFFTGHGIERIIGDGAKRAGTRPEAILDALKNPQKIVSGVDDAGRPFQVFTGRNARVVVNPQTGKVVSVKPLSGAGTHGP